MSYLTGIERSVCATWCPIAEQGDFFAAASAAGSTDSDFDTTASLESYSIATTADNSRLSPTNKTELSDRVHSITWGKTGASPFGTVAAGLPDGSIQFLDGATVLGKESVFAGNTTTKHSSPVSAVQFNALQPQIMASGADNAEIFIWNLANLESPVNYAPGKSTAATTEPISDLKWNGVVPYILGSVTQDGRVVIWDLKNKRPAVQFTDRSGKMKGCKSIAWNPKNSMQLVTASADDSSPVVQVWNLRNTQMPVATLEGHTRGVWSTSWCPQDSKYLLTTGKENKAICWNTEDFSIVSEIPLRSEWNTSIQWSDTAPATFLVSSYQETGVYSLPDVSGKRTGEDTFDRTNPPSWVSRPAGAIFGFGGKMVSVEGSTLKFDTVVSHPEIVNSAEELQRVIDMDTNDQVEYCASRARDAASEEEKSTWEFLSTHFRDDVRSAILEQIGFDKEAARQAVERLSKGEAEEEPSEEKPAQEEDETKAPEKKEDDVSNLFGDSEHDDFSASFSGHDPFGSFDAHADDPFAHHGDEDDPWSQMGGDEPSLPQHSEGGASGLSIIEMASRAEFTLNFLKQASSNDQILVRNLMLKNFAEAVECCFLLDRVADALIIAMSSNDSLLLEQTQARYYKTLPKGSVLHLASKLSQNKLKELVAHADVDEWKCTLAIICSYASSEEEFSSLCSDLGILLQRTGNLSAANLCFICGKDVARAVDIWEQEEAGKSRLEQLQSVMERIIIFRTISHSDEVSAAVTKKYKEYAELLASQGQLEKARQFATILSQDSSSSDLLIRIQAAIDADSAQQDGPSANFEPSQPSAPAQVPSQSNQFAAQPAQYQPPAKAPEPSRYVPSPVQPMQSFQPVQPVKPVQPAQPAKPYQPQPFNPIQPVQPVQPMQPLQPFQPIQPVKPAEPARTFTPVQPVQAPPMQPLQPSQPSQPRPVQPVTPLPVSGGSRPGANVFNPYAASSTPAVEPLPAAVTQAAAPSPAREEAPKPPGRVEIADDLSSNIQQLISAHQSNPANVKLLKGCDSQRISLLRQKLEQNELSDDTVESLDQFVKALGSGNQQAVKEQYEWLTKHKYSEVSAKVMLGLKKLASVEF